MFTAIWRSSTPPPRIACTLCLSAAKSTLTFRLTATVNMATWPMVPPGLSGGAGGLQVLRPSPTGRLIAELRPAGGLGGRLPPSPMCGSRPGSAALRSLPSGTGPLCAFPLNAEGRSSVYTAPAEAVGVHL